jgi:hypothetical protein
MGAAVGVTTRPSASSRITISASAVVICAACEVPSPSHAPSTYGGRSRSRAGSSSGLVSLTE